MEHVTLSNLEKKVVLGLKELGRVVTVPEIVSKTQLSESEVNRAIEWLKEKKIISTEDIEKELFKANELALEYVINDFPEQRFLKAILHKPAAVGEVAKLAGLDRNEFNVSLGLLKNSEAIIVSGGKATITEEGKAKLKELDEQKELIKFIEQPKYVEEISHKLIPFIAGLEKRQLVRRHIEKIRKVKSDTAAINSLGKLEIKDEIDILTSSMIVNRSWEGKDFKRYALDVPAKKLLIGKKQPYMKYVDEVKRILVGLGFQEMKGPIVEFSLYNCDMLYMPQDHPAREIQDAFYLKGVKGDIKNHSALAEKVKAVHETGSGTESTGWNYKFSMEKTAELLLRSQTTAVSARTLSSPNFKVPCKYFTIDRNYRVDTIDWKHLLEFDQMEGFVADETITFRELLGMLKLAAEQIAGAEQVRFAPCYYPFTEPSVEMHAFIKGKGWVELGGAGMFRPEVLEPLGIKTPIIAWGLGLGRMFMIKHNITDIRQLYSTDLNWLREFKW